MFQPDSDTSNYNMFLYDLQTESHDKALGGRERGELNNSTDGMPFMLSEEKKMAYRQLFDFPNRREKNLAWKPYFYGLERRKEMRFPNSDVTQYIGNPDEKDEDYQSIQATEGNNRDESNRYEIGDLIRFPRCIYYHWGIYIGNDHFAHINKEKNDAEKDKGTKKLRIIIESLNENRQKHFKGNNMYDEKHQAVKPAETIQTVIQLLHIASMKYRILTMNCEHFVTYCRYKCAMSKQGEKVPFVNLSPKGTKETYEDLIKDIDYTSTLKKEKQMIRFLRSCPQALKMYNESVMKTAKEGDVFFWRSSGDHLWGICIGPPFFVHFNKRDNKIEKASADSKFENSFVVITNSSKTMDDGMRKLAVLTAKKALNLKDPKALIMNLEDAKALNLKDPKALIMNLEDAKALNLKDPKKAGPKEDETFVDICYTSRSGEDQQQLECCLRREALDSAKRGFILEFKSETGDEDQNHWAIYTGFGYLVHMKNCDEYHALITCSPQVLSEKAEQVYLSLDMFVHACENPEKVALRAEEFLSCKSLPFRCCKDFVSECKRERITVQKAETETCLKLEIPEETMPESKDCCCNIL